MLTPDDVRNVAFSKPKMGKRGYSEDQVDAFLEAVEATLRTLYGRLAQYEGGHQVSGSSAPPPPGQGYTEH